MGTEPRFRLTFWKAVFFVIMAIGAYAMFVRVFQGLGASTGLSDDFPWGIWIGFDVMTGVALAAGGFTIAATVYVLHLEEFRPILRPTILTAFLGYLLVCVSLICDLGRPDRIYHPLFLWNSHSVMFEVAWCVMLYNTVLALEFSPAVLEKLGWKKALHVVHLLTPLLVIAGVVLSTLHQSSLGTVFVIVPNKLHGLWYTPFLPVLFWLSAISVGLAMTIFESYLSNRAYGVSLHQPLLQKLGKALAVVLAVYLTARIATLALAGNLGLILEGSTESLLFALEVLFGVIVPMVMLSMRKVRENRAALFYAAFLVVIGLVLNRMNVGITGMQRSAAVTYIPSFLEASISVAFVAGGLAVFGFVARHFPVFSAHTADGREAPTAWDAVPAVERVPRYGNLTTRRGPLVFAGLGLVFAGALLVVTLMPEKHATAVPSEQSIALQQREIPRPNLAELKLPDDQIIRTSDRSPAPVVFSHARHVGRNQQPCTNCHPKPFGMVRMEPGAQECASATMAACATCHDGSATFEVGAGCQICHPVDSNRGGRALTGSQSCAECHAHWKPGTTTPKCPGARAEM